MSPTFADEPATPSGPPRGLRQRIGLGLGPALLAITLIAPPPQGMEILAWRTAGLGLWMAAWWISEALPIPATALLPLALLPLLGLGTIEVAATPYANPVIFLFLGGFLIAGAVQRWELHRRIALHIVRFVGTEPKRLIGGFMLATAFLSMWVSNTATVVMMLPIGLSVIELCLRRGPDAPKGQGDSHFALNLMLGIAYAASIGGVGTLIGTPPNALLAGFMSTTYGVRIGFGEWMFVGVPFVALTLPLAWLALTRWIYPVRALEIPGGEGLIRGELARLGRMGRPQKLVALVFALTALAWIFRPLVEARLPLLTDAGIAILAALVLFALPVGQGERALRWEDTRAVPWDVLVLFGGGLSLAGAVTRSGLAEWIGAALTGVGALHVFAIMAVVTFVMIFLTELTSNTASAAAFLPVLAALAVGIGQDPLMLALPAVLAASCAFMLPVATPPNAIVFGSGFISLPQMARAGLWLNLLFALLIPVLCYAILVSRLVH